MFKANEAPKAIIPAKAAFWGFFPPANQAIPPTTIVAAEEINTLDKFEGVLLSLGLWGSSWTGSYADGTSSTFD